MGILPGCLPETMILSHVVNANDGKTALKGTN